MSTGYIKIIDPPYTCIQKSLFYFRNNRQWSAYGMGVCEYTSTIYQPSIPFPFADSRRKKYKFVKTCCTIIIDPPIRKMYFSIFWSWSTVDFRDFAQIQTAFYLFLLLWVIIVKVSSQILVLMGSLLVSYRLLNTCDKRCFFATFIYSELVW